MKRILVMSDARRMRPSHTCTVGNRPADESHPISLERQVEPSLHGVLATRWLYATLAREGFKSGMTCARPELRQTMWKKVGSSSWSSSKKKKTLGEFILVYEKGLQAS